MGFNHISFAEYFLIKDGQNDFFQNGTECENCPFFHGHQMPTFYQHYWNEILFLIVFFFQLSKTECINFC